MYDLIYIFKDYFRELRLGLVLLRGVGGENCAVLQRDFGFLCRWRPVEGEKYDAIVYPLTLNQISNVASELIRVREYLRDDGYIIAFMPTEPLHTHLHFPDAVYIDPVSMHKIALRAGFGTVLADPLHPYYIYIAKKDAKPVEEPRVCTIDDARTAMDMVEHHGIRVVPVGTMLCRGWSLWDIDFAILDGDPYKAVDILKRHPCIIDIVTGRYTYRNRWGLSRSPLVRFATLDEIPQSRAELEEAYRMFKKS